MSRCGLQTAQGKPGSDLKRLIFIGTYSAFDRRRMVAAILWLPLDRTATTYVQASEVAILRSGISWAGNSAVQSAYGNLFHVPVEAD